MRLRLVGETDSGVPGSGQTIGRFGAWSWRDRQRLSKHRQTAGTNVSTQVCPVQNNLKAKNNNSATGMFQKEVNSNKKCVKIRIPWLADVQTVNKWRLP